MTDLQFWGVIVFLAFAGGLCIGYVLARMSGSECPDCEARYEADLERRGWRP